MLVTPETDASVWRSVQIALADDAREPAVRLHLAALGHPAPEVRRRACRYLAKHGGPEHVPQLVAALQDSSRAVVISAVEALAAIGHLESPLPLVSLLAGRDASLRLAVAVALTRLEHESGVVALERLAYERDPKIRRDVAQAMGQSPNGAFLHPLMRLLDDQLGVKRAALESLPRVVGEDMGAPRQGELSSMDEQISRWKQWYVRRGRQTVR
jgi:HEAT repeat protein